MTNETHGNGTEQTPKRSQKPVVVYIFILFIAAFLMMALSLLMHQRSNTEALGQLQHSVSNMAEIQAVQEKVIDLQDQLADAEDTVSSLEEQLEALEASSGQALDEARLENKALLMLYTLQQQYSGKNYEACMETMRLMEEEDLLDHLPQTLDSTVTPPAFRYQQFKEAVLRQLHPED